ncbi:MAG TPA: bifunctional nuclease family protein [Acidimicrobiales bacterium]|nr:bifunctional nuclease family protein [Acidimicrobiales bacterium]
MDESAASESVDAAPEAPVDETVIDVPATTFRVMTLDSVLYDLTDPSPQAHLIEAESPYRYLVIPVALSDAISLQAALTRVEGRRPSTHELMTTILSRLQVDVIAVRIVRYEAGVFYAELELMTSKGREIFDCRTSDALALAYRQVVPAPVLCADDVFNVYFRD